MQFILTCPNGKKIDMSDDILRQIMGEITHDEIEERIIFYQNSNPKQK